MNSQLIKHLQNIKKQTEDFQKIAKNYPRGHQHYKQKIKKFQLELIGDIKRMRMLKSDKLANIDLALNTFAGNSAITSKNCDEITEKIDYAIQDLELNEEHEEDFTERIYDKNLPFDFHNDIKEIIGQTKKELFVVEPFVDDHLLEITLKDFDKNLNLKILTNSKHADMRGKFEKLANLFKIQQIGGFEVRESEDIHDRAIFIDKERGWVVGQSIKDAGKKPTYLIKLQNSKKLEEIYDKIWKQSKKIK